jgi:predicted metal-dependent peptidase
MNPRLPTDDERALLESTLVAARIVRPYYGRAIAALTPMCVDGLGTVAVDARWRLYVDPVWLGHLSLEQRAAVIAQHEIEHLLRDHKTRCQAISADPKRWNCAADLEINDDADQNALPPNGMYPSTFGLPDGLLAEEYYHSLEDQDHAGGGSTSSSSSGSSGGKTGGSSGGTSSSGGGGDGDGSDGGTSGGGSCGGGSGVGRPREFELADVGSDAGGVSEVEADVIRDQVASDIRDYVTTHGRGSVPAHIVMWANARARAPVRDWRRDLSAHVQAIRREIASGRADYSWRRLPRRTSAVVRPGVAAYKPRVAIVVDTSGSMGNRGSEVVGHVMHLARAAGDCTIVQCDAQVTRVTRTVPREWRGGGGTDMCVALAHDAVVHADVVIVITDCDTPWPAKLPRHTIIVCPQNVRVPEGAKTVRLS